MQDEIQKRNTDCVYFLASPLTCKKGIECEFRHSESARLNPRDCWYWLSGNCLNPTCAFRHPPLDGHTETSSEPATVPQQLTVNKTNVPCYFYFNGFCNKGDRCSFLHGPDGVSPAWKSSKTTPIVTDVHPMESKTSKGSDTGPTSIEMPPHQSKTTSKLGLNIQRKGDPQQSVPTFVEQISSPPILMPECEEAAIKSDSPPPAEDFIENQSHLSLDQSSEEQVDSHIEPEEWWESSPGFDVLVDDDSENLGYEDDPKFLLTHDMEARELHDHFLRYDYKDPAGYDPMEYPEYPDAGNLYKHERYDSYDHLENEHISDYVRRVPDRLSERMLDPILFQKRKFLPRELKVDVPDGVDLRDHLRKRRRIDGRLVSQNPRRHGSSSLDDWSRERPANHSKGVPPRRRLASEVGKNMIGSHRENEIGLNDNHRRGWLRHSQPRRNRSRQREKEKGRQSRPRFLPSEISRGPASSETRRNVQESTAFTGPKTLAQIKEEKRKARENGDGFGNTGCSNRTTSVDFQSPRSLNEILKDKRRLGSLSDDNTSRRSKHDVEPEMNHDYQIKDENDFVDEDDEDDDGLEKKLASILS